MGVPGWRRNASQGAVARTVCPLVPGTAIAAVNLKLDGEPRVVKATRDLPVRPHRDDKERPIGVVEAGAEVFVMEVLSGWTNVLPKNLGLMPGEDGGFWIPSAEVSKP